MPGGGQHSTAATLERVDSEAAVLPQDFEDTVHARQLKALCRRVGRMMSRLSNREKLGMDQFVWDVPAWVVCPGEGVG